MRRTIVSVAVMTAWLAGQGTAETLTGTALVRERIALPPGLTFEAVIEDIGRADAPAIPLARTVIEDAGQPPIRFSIDHDPASHDPEAIYALRATIRQGDRLLFATDTATRVLEGPDRPEVELILRRVAQDDLATSLPAPGLRLPATFRGTLPCADCEGIRHHLDLWPDRTYHLGREWLGRAEPLGRDEIGRWHFDPERAAIVLTGPSGMSLHLQVTGPDRLRLMDREGNPIVSDLPHDLTGDGRLDPAELGGLVLLGRMTYMADAALFEECLTGRRYPISQETDYLALERAYLGAAAEPGAPVVVEIEGALALRPGMEGPARTSVVVDRFTAVREAGACDAAAARAILTETAWRIDSLMGQPLRPSGTPGGPRLSFRGGDMPRFRATVGCNQIIGGFETDGAALRFSAAASTRMACPPPLDMLEARLIEVLGLTRAIRLEGRTLELRDEAGATIAGLTAGDHP